MPPVSLTSLPSFFSSILLFQNGSLFFCKAKQFLLHICDCPLVLAALYSTYLSLHKSLPSHPPSPTPRSTFSPDPHSATKSIRRKSEVHLPPWKVSPPRHPGRRNTPPSVPSFVRIRSALFNFAITFRIRAGFVHTFFASSSLEITIPLCSRNTSAWTRRSQIHLSFCLHPLVLCLLNNISHHILT